MSKKSASTLLGLALKGGRLVGVLLRRTNGSLKVSKTVDDKFSMQLLADDPELVGREIRNILDRAGVRERRCLFCLPAGWVTSRQVRLPDLPEEDLQSFLALEAERGFHLGQDMLAMVTSRYQTPSGEVYATQMAVPLTHLSRLESILRAARLRSVSFTPGILAMERPEEDGLLTLEPGEDRVELLLTGGGGVVALRSLDAPTAGGEGDEESLVREIRITLGQIPASFRGKFKRAHLLVGEQTNRSLMEGLSLELDDLGLACQERKETFPADLVGKLPPGTEASPVVVATARHLKACPTGFEFLPPRVSSWQRFSRKVSSRKLAWAGAAAAALALMMGSAFFYQHWELSRLESRWTAIRPQVEELDGLQERLRKYRPWFDDSMGHLKVLLGLTESFPEDGRVTAKTLEIREDAGMGVSCTGTARDNQALLDTLDQLRAQPGVGGLKVDQIRGKSPLQFVFNYRWNPNLEENNER